MKMKRKIMKALSLLTINPLVLFRHLSCIIIPRCLLPKSSVQKNINGVLFDFDLSIDPAIKKMYLGGYSLEIIRIMKEVLKPGNIFVDVGASIGYISAIGAGLVGKSGQVHSFEPVPQFFQRLEKMAMINPEYKIVVNQCALGKERGTVNIAISNVKNIGWNTIVPNYINKETLKEVIKVPIYRLDNYVKEKAINDISLIKIDTEGFEFPVLEGLKNYFENTNHRPVIICEIAPSAYPLLGYSLDQLSEYMKKYNYNSYSEINTNAEVDITKLKETSNVVFIASV